MDFELFTTLLYLWFYLRLHSYGFEFMGDIYGTLGLIFLMTMYELLHSE